MRHAHNRYYDSLTIDSINHTVVPRHEFANDPSHLGISSRLMAADSRPEILSWTEYVVGIDDPKIVVLGAPKSRTRLRTSHFEELQSKLSLNIRHWNCWLVEPFANFFEIHIIFNLL